MPFAIGSKVRTKNSLTNDGVPNQVFYGIVVALPPGSTDYFIKLFQAEYGAPVPVQVSTTGESCDNLIPYPVLWGENGIEAA